MIGSEREADGAFISSLSTYSLSWKRTKVNSDLTLIDQIRKHLVLTGED